MPFVGSVSKSVDEWAQIAQVSQRIGITWSTLYCWLTSPYVLTSPYGIP